MHDPTMRFIVLDKSCREIQNILIMLRNFFGNGVVCEITWKNMVESNEPQITSWRMRIACWITKATNTHSEYVLGFFFAFSAASMVSQSPYKYIKCPSYCTLKCIHMRLLYSM